MQACRHLTLFFCNMTRIQWVLLAPLLEIISPLVSTQPSLPSPSPPHPTPAKNSHRESKVSYSRTKYILMPVSFVSWSSAYFQIFHQENNPTCNVFSNFGNFLPSNLCSINFGRIVHFRNTFLIVWKRSQEMSKQFAQATKLSYLHVCIAHKLSKKIIENSHFL